MTKPLISGILFSTTVNAELVAKPLILDILFSTSVILELKPAFTTKLLTSGILFSAASSSSLLATPLPCFSISSIFELSALHLVFKTNPVVSISTFVTTLLYSVSLTTFFTTLLNLAKSLGTGVHLSISNLSTSVFNLAKFDFSAKLLTLSCDSFFKSVFVA